MAKAKERHDASLASVLAYLKGLGVAVTDLQTGGIRFDKDFNPGDSSYFRRNPYTCSTQLSFTLVDFEQYGPICDTLAKIDGLMVQSVNYRYSKEAEVRHDALKRALLNAHEKANELAVTANCTIDHPLSILEQEAYNVSPETMNASYTSKLASTPDAVAGQIEIGAKVTACYDLLPK